MGALDAQEHAASRPLLLQCTYRVHTTRFVFSGVLRLCAGVMPLQTIRDGGGGSARGALMKTAISHMHVVTFVAQLDIEWPSVSRW